MMKILLVLFSSLKLGKILTTGGSMLVSIIAYAFVFGWMYAVGFVLLIFIHEMGHYIAARKKGLDVGVPVFIPFVGAWIQLKEIPHDAKMEAYIGLAGPFIGTLGALGCYYAGRECGSNLLLALSYSGFFLNLFNLIPLPPLDGGRITAVLSPKLWLVGIPILIVMFFYQPSPILFFIAILAIPQVIKFFRNKSEENSDYYEVDGETKIIYGTFYIGLVIFLVLMVEGVYAMISHIR